MTDAITVFVCHGDMEAAWIASVCAEGEREMQQWERDEDRDHEAALALECVLDGEIDAWPDYADSPIEVEDPEVIYDADVLGLPVESADGDDLYDDGTP